LSIHETGLRGHRGLRCLAGRRRSDARSCSNDFSIASRERWALVTTNAVVVETYSVLLARARNGRRAALGFLDAVERSASAITVESIRGEDEKRAFALVRAHTDKSYSLCDALSFAVMERLGITEAIAFDRHFREYGRFTIL
jgi:predicted nucleic acid-binding protein